MPGGIAVVMFFIAGISLALIQLWPEQTNLHPFGTASLV
jgi:hypothetical membrane protein